MAELRGITFDYSLTLSRNNKALPGLRTGLAQLRDEQIAVGIVSGSMERTVLAFLLENEVLELVEPSAIFGIDSVRVFLREQRKQRHLTGLRRKFNLNSEPHVAIVPSVERVQPKPNPHAMEFLLKQAWKIPPAEVAHVGDDEITDQWFAQRAGVAFVQVNLFDDMKSLPDLINDAKDIIKLSSSQAAGG